MDIEREYNKKLAKRILDQVALWDREDKPEEEQIEDTIQSMYETPNYIIEFLLDIIDELQA